jgi:hypothetical protein
LEVLLVGSVEAGDELSSHGSFVETVGPRHSLPQYGMEIMRDWGNQEHNAATVVVETHTHTKMHGEELKENDKTRAHLF